MQNLVKKLEDQKKISNLNKKIDKMDIENSSEIYKEDKIPPHY